MEYLDLGMVLATISVPVAIYYMLTASLSQGLISVELTKWWNGESYYSELIPLEVVGMTLICALTFLLMFISYPLIIGGAISIKVVVLLRNKRLEVIKNQN